MAGITRSTGMHMDEELGMGMGMGMESMMCGDLFDHIEDLLDFPNDTDAEMMVDPSCNIDALQFPAIDEDELLLVPPPLQVESHGGFLPNQQSEINLAAPAAPVENTFNEEDDKVYENLEISDMDWFSNFIYDTADSFSLSFPADHISSSSNNNTSIKEDSMFRTSSPISVLEPNNSGAGGNGSSASSSSSSFSSSASTKKNVANNVRTLPSNPLESAVPARAHNKRPRTTTFSPRPHVSISFLPPSPETAPESFGESLASPSIFKKKKKATKLTEAPDCASPSARKCTHCQIQKTPQWRAGPLGPKTLCNACGVRYKSGRLFPEYRPAASPTFVPAVHSNSHKKVVEIRLKTTTTVPSREDLLEYIRRRE